LRLLICIKKKKKKRRRRVNVGVEKEEWAGERRKVRAVVRGRGERAGGEEERVGVGEGGLKKMIF